MHLAEDSSYYHGNCSSRAQNWVAVVSVSLMLDAQLWSKLLAHRMTYGVKQEKSAKQGDDIIDQVAVPENHQGGLRLNRVSTLKCNVGMSRRLNAE